MTNNEIFLEFWKNYRWPEPAPIFYRLYHDDDGSPVIYTMEDLPGKYIEVSVDQYRMADHHVRVIDGRLVPRDPVCTVRKIKPADAGTPCHPRDVTIIVDQSAATQSWNKR